MNGDFVIFGIPAAAMIVILVELLKTVVVRPKLDADGLPGVDSDGHVIMETPIRGRVSVLCALGLGFVLAAANYIAQVVPGFDTAWGVIGAGLIAALTASGFYSGQKAIRGD